MKSFDDWFKEDDPFCGNDGNADCIWAKKYLKLSYEAGQQSQQSEVDELLAKKEFRDLSQDKAIARIKQDYEKQLSSMAKAMTKMDVELDKLQERIDEAIKCMEQNKPIALMDYKHAIDALFILKGKSE